MKPHSSLAWAAIVLSLIFGIAGVAHTTAVISVALREGKPYDFRLVSLLATGGVLVYPGLINIGITRVLTHTKTFPHTFRSTTSATAMCVGASL